MAQVVLVGRVMWTGGRSKNQRKNSRPSFPSQPILMFSNVKKYSKNFIQESLKKSNDQNLSSFGTFQTPLPLWKYEEVSNTCSIFCRTAQFTAFQSFTFRVGCIAMHIGAYWLLSILQSIGCLPSTKSTHQNLLLLLLLLHNNICFCAMKVCPWTLMHNCALQIVQRTRICATV